MIVVTHHFFKGCLNELSAIDMEKARQPIGVVVTSRNNKKIWDHFVEISLTKERKVVREDNAPTADLNDRRVVGNYSFQTNEPDWRL